MGAQLQLASLDLLLKKAECLSAKNLILGRGKKKKKGTKEDTDIVNRYQKLSEEARDVDESEMQQQNSEEQNINSAVTAVALF